MLHFWLVWRYISSGRKYLNLTHSLSFLGITIGVACLVASMAVVSGFETTLKNSVIDVAGHILVIKRGGQIRNGEKLVQKIKEEFPQVIAQTPFVQLEAVLAHGATITGVQVQGVDEKTVEQVLRLKKRVVLGKFDLRTGDDEEVAPALIGKGLAKKFDLELGEEFKIIMPHPSKTHSVSFSPLLRTFRLVGVLDLGKHEYDQRIVVVPMVAAQKLGRIGKRISGLRLRLEEADEARDLAFSINGFLGYPFWTVDWQEVNSNLFEAIKLEKVVIFFVVLVMIIAACFNVSSTLFVTVRRRFSDISIFKAMGANRFFLWRLFSSHGLFIGIVGTLLGLLLGLVFAYGFFWLQEGWNLLPGDVYKLDKIVIEIRWTDMLAVFCVSILVCFFSTLAPAIRGANFNPVEGIRHE